MQNKKCIKTTHPPHHHEIQMEQTNRPRGRPPVHGPAAPLCFDAAIVGAACVDIRSRKYPAT